MDSSILIFLAISAFSISIQQILPRLPKNQTTRYKPYRNLKPITSPLHLFHIITSDFIVELSLTAIGNGEFNVCATLTCKFLKYILVESGKTN